MYTRKYFLRMLKGLSILQWDCSRGWVGDGNERMKTEGMYYLGAIKSAECHSQAETSRDELWFAFVFSFLFAVRLEIFFDTYCFITLNRKVEKHEAEGPTTHILNLK